MGNPLLPSEPMRIRTGETETRFSLPQGTEFYLRQESAPEGFIFDAQTLIPVTDSEIVIRNQAYGRVTISVRDTLGEGIEGVSLTATDGAGNQTELVTDENGQAVLLCDHAGAYAIAESGLPEGVLPAENDSVQVQAAPPSAAEVAFEHPAPGSCAGSRRHSFPSMPWANRRKNRLPVWRCALPDRRRQRMRMARRA